MWAFENLRQPAQCLQGFLECFDGSQGPQNPGSTNFRKKRPNFLKFIEPVTPLWVLYPSENMRVVFPEPSLARAVFARSIKVFRWQPAAPKSREHDLPKKNPDFFGIHWTSDNSMGFAALPNHAYGLYGTFTGQSSVCKVN